jgi:MYXO-CTERM domain-containing protein
LRRCHSDDGPAAALGLFVLIALLALIAMTAWLALIVVAGHSFCGDLLA